MNMKRKRLIWTVGYHKRKYNKHAYTTLESFTNQTWRFLHYAKFERSDVLMIVPGTLKYEDFGT